MTTVSDILGYQVLATLGYGARSAIYAVKDRDNHLYALKRVVRNDASDQRFLDQAITEHEIARRFCHPNLRQSFKLLRQRQFIRTKEVIVLMELVDGRPLEQYTPRSMVELCSICQQATLALSEMHQGGFVHCDIKPNNILLTSEGVVKIIDFGQSCPTGTIKERIQGTPDYIAPEQVLRHHITPATDVFNLGASMYWMLTGHHVPTMIAKNPQNPMGPTKHQLPPSVQPPRQVNPDVPPALSSLVMDCVETEPFKRPATMTEVHDRLGISKTQAEGERSARRAFRQQSNGGRARAN